MMTFLLSGLGVIYQVLFRAIGANRIYSVVCIFLASALFATNRQNPDWLNYVAIFEQPELYAEVGYVLLVKLLKLLGLGHEGVVLVLAILVCLTFFRYLDYSSCISGAILLYLIYPMAIDITQIRNTFGLFFILNMLIEIERRNFVLALLCLAVAASFHYFFLSYLLLFLLIVTRGARYWSVAIVLSTSIALVLAPYVLSFVISIGVLRNIEAYLSQDIKYHSLLIWGAVLIADILCFGTIRQYFMTPRLFSEKLSDILFSTMVSGIPFLVGLLYVDDFHRFFRSLFLIKYLLASIMWPAISIQGRVLITLYLVLSVAVFGSYFNLQLGFDSILFPPWLAN